MDSVHTQQACGPACLQAVDELVQLARKLNQQRSSDHRERISAAVASVREYFRDGREGELPSNQASPLLARVTALDWACDASPEGYARAIDALAAGLDETRNAAQRMRTNPPQRAPIFLLSLNIMKRIFTPCVMHLSHPTYVHHLIELYLHNRAQSDRP